MTPSRALPPYEEWPRIGMWSWGPVRWWWTRPIGILVGWELAAVLSGADQLALMGLVAIPVTGFPFAYCQYRTCRRNAPPSLPS